MSTPRSLASAACCVTILVGVACSKEPDSPPVAELISAEGSVQRVREGSESAAQPGPLLAGDIIVTGPDSSAIVRSSDGRELVIGEQTRFTIGTRMGGLTLELDEGSITTRGEADEGQPGLSLTILTPFGETSIPAGSSAGVSMKKGSLSVSVEEGAITITDKEGNTQSGTAGQRLVLTLEGVEIVPAGAAAGAADAGRPALEIAPIELRLSSTRGKAQLKNPTDKRFRALSKEDEAAPAGTAFRLSPKAGAVLTGDGLRLSLDDGAKGTVGEAKQEGGRTSYRVRLEAGSSGVLFSGEGERELTIEGPGAPVQLKADRVASATFSRTRAGAKVEVLGGELTVSSDGREEKVKAGQVAELGKKGLKVADRAPPSLVLPADRRVRVYARRLERVGLGWPASAREGRVEVATDAEFSELIAVGEAERGHLAIEPPASGDLRWRVLGPDGAVLHNGHARFQWDPERSPLELETQGSEVAETGLKATVYFQSVLPKLVFTFPPHQGATRYRLRVYRTGQLGAPLLERACDEPKCPVPSGSLGEGDYVWHAAPLDKAGKEIGGGRMNKLEIVYDNSMTTLAISRPKSGDRISGSTVSVAGVAPLGASLYVNGRAVKCDEKGRFSTELPRSETVVFRLAGAGGSEHYWVRRVRTR